MTPREMLAPLRAIQLGDPTESGEFPPRTPSDPPKVDHAGLDFPSRGSSAAGSILEWERMMRRDRDVDPGFQQQMDELLHNQPDQ